MSISRQIKTHVLTALLHVEDLLGAYNEFGGVVDFLSFIWPIRDLSSTDGRYKNAYEDAKQHMVNNNDWTLEYALKDRFHLIEGDEEYFIKFLETVVSPVVRQSKDRISSYVTTINALLTNTNVALKLVDYFEDLPVYKIRNKNSESLPPDLAINNLSFYIYRTGYELEEVTPGLRLQYDRWNDYGMITQYDLYYFRDEITNVHIGRVKIMTPGVEETFTVIPRKFTSLPPNFCSLGQSELYYETLKRLFPENYQSILFAIRDVAFFPKIREEFETNNIFSTSLTREDVTEQLMRTIKLKLFGMDLNTCFKFGYKYKL